MKNLRLKSEMPYSYSMEQWKQIEGYDFYMVSDQGQVKSLRYGKERILKPFRLGNYLGVWLGAGHKHYIHHLVAKAFHTPIEGFEIDHINRQKHDNRATNLRWVSSSDNHKNACVKGHYRTINGVKYYFRPHIVV